MMLRSTIGAVVLVVATLAGFRPAAAQSPPSQSSSDPPAALVTERPTFSASASTVVPMRLQLEAGIRYDHRDFPAQPAPLDHRGSYDTNGVSAPNALLRFGISDFAELRVGVPDWAYINTTNAGSDTQFGSVSAGAKFAGALVEDLRVGIIPFVDIATDGGDVGGGLIATAAVGLTDTVSMGLNAGITTHRTPLDERAYQGRGSVAASIGLTDAISAFVEPYALLADQQLDVLVDTGLTYLVAPSVQLDAYLGSQLPEAEQIFAGAGISVRLPKFCE